MYQRVSRFSTVNNRCVCVYVCVHNLTCNLNNGFLTVLSKYRETDPKRVWEKRFCRTVEKTNSILLVLHLLVSVHTPLNVKYGRKCGLNRLPFAIILFVPVADEKRNLYRRKLPITSAKIYISRATIRRGNRRTCLLDFSMIIMHKIILFMLNTLMIINNNFW